MAGVASAGDGLVALSAPRVPTAVAFIANGLLFATLFARIAEVRTGLALSDGSFGLLLLCASGGSMVALPLAGRIIERIGPATTVRCGVASVCVGELLVALGAGPLASFAVTAVGLAGFGLGMSVWDVAMNLEAAEVERRLGRTIMPRFHAGWSAGSILGTLIGVPLAAASVSLLAQVVVVSLGALAAVVWATGSFLPAHTDAAQGPRESAWRDPRTLLIGVVVLCFAMVEGTANDWLSLAIIDGYHQPHWMGVVGFGCFVAAMTTGRVLGPALLDRVGRPVMLWASAGAAAVGVLVTAYAGALPVAFVGIVIWGLGAALGFPVGMSAGAGDDPARAAARVSVVATIGYAAFLAGPPLLGQLGNAVGTLHAITVVAVLMVPAAFAVAAVRSRQPVGEGVGDDAS